MKNKKYTLLFSIIFTIILFLMFDKEHFASDTYVFSNNILENSNWYLINGRVVMYLFLKLSLLFGLCTKTIKFVSLILSFISLFVSSIILNKILSKYINKDLLRGIIVAGIIYSPFIFEFYLFPEYTGVMCLGILFSVMSLYFLLKYFDSKKIFCLFVSLLFCLFVILSYQGIASFFCVLSLFVLFLYNSDIKVFIKNNLYVFFIYGFSSGIGLLIAKIMKLSRLDTVGYDLVKSIKNIFSGLKHLVINTSYVFPRYFFLVLILFIFIILIFLLIKLNKKKDIFLILYLIVASIIISLLPQFFVRYDLVFVVPRSNVIIGVIPLMLFMIYFSFFENYDKYVIISLIVIILSFILQIIGWYQIREDHYYTNVADRTDATEILNKIKKYEIDNNVVINNISYVYDSNIKQYYDEVWSFDGNVNQRAFASDWGVSGIINYYSEKKYNFIPAPDELIDKCSKNNWNLIRNDMFEFKDDTLYMCVY